MNINENIALAKSILNKKGITPDSEKYNDYLKIREICGPNIGYVGILTKIRFIYDVTDIDELESIFLILKNSKIDVGKLNKLTYPEILDKFYYELNVDNTDNNKDYELVLKDEAYSYFRVNTYEGILKIGSPSWCLKTKSKWDLYMSVYDQQWVAIDNEYLKNIISPSTMYFSEYKNVSKKWIRYGVSVKIHDDKKVSWEGFDDNNNKLKYDVLRDCTSYGVQSTIFNLAKNEKKPYYDGMYGFTKEGDSGWLHVDNNERIKSIEECIKKFGLSSEDSDNYIYFSTSYSRKPFYLSVSDYHIYLMGGDKIEDPTFKLDSKVIKNIIKRADSAPKYVPIFLGINLYNNRINIDDIKSDFRFIDIFNNWVIMNYNEYYYLAVNINLKATDKVCIPYYEYSNGIMNIDSKIPTLYFYIKKYDYKIKNLDEVKGYHKEVVNFIKNKIEAKNTVSINNIDNIDTEIENKGVGIIKKFKNFFK